MKFTTSIIIATLFISNASAIANDISEILNISNQKQEIYLTRVTHDADNVGNGGRVSARKMKL